MPPLLMALFSYLRFENLYFLLTIYILHGNNINILIFSVKYNIFSFESWFYVSVSLYLKLKSNLLVRERGQALWFCIK